MPGTTERALAVLAALQRRPTWTGPELATHLGVTSRTVRRDVERLRELGYPVEADVGARGGYRLGVGGAAVPPLSLDTDEAFALAVSVRAFDAGSVAGVREPASRALAKLERLLPNPLRQQAAALSNATIRVDTIDAAGAGGGEQADAEVLRAVSLACQRGDELSLTYRPRDREAGSRRVEPYRVVGLGRRWYLVARDVDAARRAPDDAWRTLRVDRITEVRVTGHPVRFTDPPDPVHLVQHAVSTAPYRWSVEVTVDAPAADVVGLLPPSVAVVEAVGSARTSIRTGGDRLDVLALHIAALGLPFRVVSPPELTEVIAGLAERLRAAVS